MSLSINNFVNFTVSAPGAGVPAYNVNSLGILTKETPSQNYGHGAILTATVSGGAVNGVTITAAGSNYTTAPSVYFTGGTAATNQTIVLPVVTVTISGGSINTVTIVSGGSGYATAPTVVIGSTVGYYTNALAVGADFGTTSETYAMAEEVFAQTPNIISGGGQLLIYPMTSVDTLSTALFAFTQLTYVGGVCWAGYQPSTSEIVAAATLVQSATTPYLLFAPTSNISDLYAGGTCYQIQQSTLQQTRNLLYTLSAQGARYFSAAYASRLLSTNFYGSNTTITMNLKQLTGIQPGTGFTVDTGITQTIYTQCQTVGADFYTSIQGLPETVSTGGNGYSDNVYNMTWLLGALQTATFNFLAQTPTKIPQTESGMSSLKGAIATVLNQAVTNGFLAPGAWTASTFGDPVSLVQNIANFGYYIYSQPVSLQVQSQRATRTAPLIQIGVKYAGAIQSVNGIIYINP